MPIAMTRPISQTFNQCQLTHLDREPIDVALAQRQHAAYEQALAELGCRVQPLPAAPDLPDAVFVEDAALVLPELAVITRPGAETRRAETVSVAEALGQFRRLAAIEPPGTLDGGDILRLGRAIFVGQSSRSNAAAIEQLAALGHPFGYTVRAVPVTGCLHLKSAVTQVGPNTLLINRDWVDDTPFAGFDLVDVAAAEPGAANALWLGNAVILPAQYRQTRQKLQAYGLNVVPVDVTEIAKAEGGVTCCSLIFEA